MADFHARHEALLKRAVTGGNPAGNATLTDAAFVANRFASRPCGG